MKLRKEIEITNFLNAIKKTEGQVWLESIYGDKYNLKSTLSRYVAIAALLNEHKEELDLYCNNKNDESLFFDFFAENPEAL